MANKRNAEIEQSKEPIVEKEQKPIKRRKSVMEKSIETNEAGLPEKKGEPILEEAQVKESEVTLENGEEQNKGTSLDLLLRHVFREMDQWGMHADFRDEVFLKEANYFSESMKRNQGNINKVAEQSTKELAEWERTAREEFLMSTTTLQHLFPKVSYEEMNQQIDKIQKRTASILNKSLHMMTNNQLTDQYLSMIDQYIALRKNARKQYIKNVKQAANLIYESQKGFIDIFAGQIKAFMFPLNKYMEKTEE